MSDGSSSHIDKVSGWLKDLMKVEHAESVYEESPPETPPSSAPILACSICGRTVLPADDSTTTWVCTSTPDQCKEGQAKAGSSFSRRMQLSTAAKDSKK